MEVVAPKAGDFFAASNGVSVYVNVGRHAVRVHFASAESPAEVDGEPDADTEKAVRAAARAFHAYRRRLLPLFDRIARELATRH
ncbi:MAG TPA: hypothetical protein VHB79_25030 [Polyangiaceae bacterium]|jgi:hypothetical protein|nr:hypothetical protein [Polyangiaceae bacterium]